MMKNHYPIQTLLSLQLIELPKTRQGIEALVLREGWKSIDFPGRGGRGGIRKEWFPPEAIINAIKSKKINEILDCTSEPVAITQQINKKSIQTTSPNLFSTDRQRATADARAAILSHVDALMAELKIKRSKAINEIITRAKAGTLPPHLAALVPIANGKSGGSGGRTLCRRTIYNWQSDLTGVATPGAAVAALTPKVRQASSEIPPWANDLLTAFQAPQKPSLRWAVQQICDKHGLHEDYLYGRARRFLEKMGNVEILRGRIGSREIKTVMPFRRRTTDDLLPGDIYTADGHTFDAEVAHPDHGRPFRPEVTGVVDVLTRKYVGWSIDLAESGLAVLDAFRSACEVGGIPGILYVDNGSGYKNAMMSDPATGMMARVGTTMLHSLPYNSQARGIIERSHKTVWVSAAKELPTYIGKDMDRQASNNVFKLTRAAVKASVKSPMLMDFPSFVTFCNQKIEEYNNRPHSSLAKCHDPELGRKRHMTPNEAWALEIENAQAAGLAVVEKTESRNLFRPQKEVKLIRGEVRLFNNLYFNADLKERHGEWVRVAYDVRDASSVIVYDTEGRYLCDAKLDGNAAPYMAKTVIEQAREKRAKGRLARLDAKRDEVEAELYGVEPETIMSLEDAPSPVLEPMAVAELAALNIATISPAPVPVPVAQAPRRPIFQLDSERYRWLMKNQTELDNEDWGWLREFVRSELYRDMRDMFASEGIDWHTHQQKAAI
jgi:putative transposase